MACNSTSVPDSECHELLCSENEDTDTESDTDFDPLSDNTLDLLEKLSNFPEILEYIQRLQHCLRKQQAKLKILVRDINIYESRLKTSVQLSDASTQTADMAPWETVEKTTVAEEVKKAAELAMQQTGFAYEETSGLYFDYNTGYYYNAELGLYYDGNTGVYYYYNEKSKKFEFHSQVESQVETGSKRKEEDGNVEVHHKQVTSSINSAPHCHLFCPLWIATWGNSQLNCRSIIAFTLHMKDCIFPMHGKKYCFLRTSKTKQLSFREITTN